MNSTKVRTKIVKYRVQIHILLLCALQSMIKCPLSFAWKPLSECMVRSGEGKDVKRIARNFFVPHNSLPPAYLTNRKLADEDKRWRVLIPLRKIEAFVRSEQILEVKYFWDRSRKSLKTQIFTAFVNYFYLIGKVIKCINLM